MTLGSEVAFRSFISTGSIKYMQSSGTSAGTYNNLTDALYTLPHFSI